MQVLRVVERTTVRTYSERLDAQVDADGCLTHGFGRLQLLQGCIHQYRRKVSAGRCHADGDGLHRPFEPAVQYGRNAFCLGNGDGFLAEVHAAMLRTLETLSVLAALEAWKADSMGITKKVLVGSAKVAYGI